MQNSVITSPINSYGQEIESPKLVDVFYPSRISSYPPVAGEVGSCSWSSDGRYFAWSCGHRIVKVISWNRYKDPKNENKETESVHPPVTIDAGENVRVVAFGSRTVNSKQQQSGLFRFLVIEDLILATGLCNGRIRTWDVKTGCFKLELIDHSGGVTDLSFATDGLLRMVSSSLDGTLKVWDMEDDGNLMKTLKTVSKSIFGCCWSPNSKVLASVGDYKSVLLWDMESFTVIRSFFGHQHNVSKCSFSPDGSLLATSSFDTRVIIWDVSTGIPLQNLYHLMPPPSIIYAGGANSAYIRSVSFSPDGQHVGTVCDDGFVRFWDICETDVPVMMAPVDGAVSCCFSVDGGFLAVGTAQGSAMMWQSSVRIPSLQHLCRLSIRRALPSNVLNSMNVLPTRLCKFLNYDLQ